MACEVGDGDEEWCSLRGLGLEAGLPEAYRLKVEGRKVEISAPSEAGGC